MDTFKTPKGTILPLTKIKGKDYMMVTYRLIWFREEKPGWTIETDIIKQENDLSIVKAIVKNESGITMSTAHKREDKKDFLDHLEKAETSAIGRALAMIGYGTQFALVDFDEGERIVDSPLLKPVEKPIQPTFPTMTSIDLNSLKNEFRGDEFEKLSNNINEKKITYGKKYVGLTYAQLHAQDQLESMYLFAKEKARPSDSRDEFIKDCEEFFLYA